MSKTKQIAREHVMHAVEGLIRDNKVDAKTDLRLGPYTLQAMSAWDSGLSLYTWKIGANYRIAELSEGSVDSRLVLLTYSASYEKPRAKFAATIKLPGLQESEQMEKICQKIRKEVLFYTGLNYKIEYDYPKVQDYDYDFSKVSAVKIEADIQLKKSQLEGDRTANWVDNKALIAGLDYLAALTAFFSKRIEREIRPEESTTGGEKNAAEQILDNSVKLIDACENERRHLQRKAIGKRD